MKIIQIKFEGVDSFHRAVFKALDSKERFGCVCILFDRDSSEETVLKYINEGDLCYFGNSFDCEPMGTAPGEIEIVSNVSKKNNIINYFHNDSAAFKHDCDKCQFIKSVTRDDGFAIDIYSSCEGSNQDYLVRFSNEPNGYLTPNIITALMRYAECTRGKRII